MGDGEGWMGRDVRRGMGRAGEGREGGRGKGKGREGRNTVSATLIVSPRSFSSAATSWMISRSSGGGKADDILLSGLSVQ